MLYCFGASRDSAREAAAQGSSRLLSPPLDVSRKVAILGHHGVGKTSLATRFASGRFAESYNPTIENTFARKLRLKRAHFATEIVDAAGMDEYSRLPRNASVGVHGYLLVYSSANRLSFEKVEFINQALLRVQGMSPGVVRVLVATMIDLRAQRQVPFHEGQSLADRWNVPFLECSAKDNINVNEVFVTLIKEVDKDNGGFLDTDGPKTCEIA
mmetsp:Transcript_11531/g.36646  ORF Transcript_11531/g.36646 Transcript_11531/m.36646 type:complete len:213 (-) Transcript_11531:55-693(-)